MAGFYKLRTLLCLTPFYYIKSNSGHYEPWQAVAWMWEAVQRRKRRVTGGVWAISYHDDDDCGKSLCFKKAGILWLRALNQWCEVFKVCMHSLNQKRAIPEMALKSSCTPPSMLVVLALYIKSVKRKRKCLETFCGNLTMERTTQHCRFRFGKSIH